MSDSQSNNKIIIILSIIVSVAICVLSVFGYITVTNTKQKAPFYRVVKFFDTDMFVEASYNDKYGIMRLDITIDEIIEEWQINAIGSDTTDIWLECETNDKTVKKEYGFFGVKLNKGEKLKGSIVFEDSTLKDYILLKDLLSGSINVENSKYLTLDTKERDKLQQDYYKKMQERITKARANTQRSANPSFFNNLFDF